jgi:hypothetical protein
MVRTATSAPVIFLSLVVCIVVTGFFYWLATVFPIATEVLGAFGAFLSIAVTVVLAKRVFGKRP